MNAPRSARPETRSPLGAQAPPAAPLEASQPGRVSGPRAGHRQATDSASGEGGLPGEPEEDEDDGFVPL